MALITIVTAPKPFTDPHIAMIQRNALDSWMKLGPEVEIIVVGQEEGVELAAKGLPFRHIPEVRRNHFGTPIIRSMVDAARESSNSPMLAIVNTDILLLPDFLITAGSVCETMKNYLIVSQRWDLDVREDLTATRNLAQDLQQKIRKHGVRHPRGGSDIFIFPRNCYRDMPDLVIGRAGWDNWMIYHARVRKWPVVDASNAMTIIHQSHDYGHLPGGKPHYRHPETEENIRLGGGKLTIFTLDDSQFLVKDGRLQRWQFSWKKVKREMEVFPLVVLRSRWIGMVFYALFHPLRAYSEGRAWLRKTRRIKL